MLKILWTIIIMMLACSFTSKGYSTQDILIKEENFMPEWYLTLLEEAETVIAKTKYSLSEADGIIATISLPSVEMMVQDAEHRWAVFADEKQDTEYITAQLKDAIASAQLIAQSVDPYRDKRGALVKAYRSEIDNRLQPYSVYVPLNYDSKQPYPLVV
ncbi:MAG: hypothetical protein H8D67_13775, partial [Deltaproteobacteria bacterium]|nr:hypothetical protein [Deltaproteobacteria bacterium]